MNNNTSFKIVCLLLILLCSVIRVGAQCDTLFWGDREPTFYYWDNNWIDFFDQDLEPCADLLKTNHFTTFYVPYDEGQREVARVCFTDTAFKIIGVAALVKMGSFDPIFPTADSTMLPEYFRLWIYSETDSTMVVRASARFDTVQPRYIVQSQTLWDGYIDYLGDTVYEQDPDGRRFLPLYEAYFDHPVTVSDSFYVTITSWNNYFIGKIENIELPNGEVVTHTTDRHAAHPCNFPYKAQAKRYGGMPIPPYYYTKYHKIDAFNFPTEDTNWHVRGMDRWGTFYWILPIFDTTGRNIAAPVDTCPVPLNLTLSDLTSDAAIFFWTQGYASTWDVSIAHDGVEPDSGTIFRCNDPYYAVTDLEPETWYNLWVCTVCRNNKVSPWSDSIRFYVPGADDPPTQHIPSVIDQYTYLYPNPASNVVNLYSSFHMRVIEIYSSEGRKAMSVELDANDAIIDISALPQGTYYIRIETDHGPTVKQLVVL